MSKKKILVIGATGQQGGSVVNALKKYGHDVSGLTRNVTSDKAKELSGEGINLIAGDMNNIEFLEDTFRKFDSVFLIGTPFENGVESESAQGINAVKAAAKAGIKHLVYNSVGNADKNTGIPHFDSKFKVEQELSGSGVSYTIIAPVFFYDNMMAPFMLPGLKEGNLAAAMPAEVRLQSISARNIGEMSALALDQTDRFFGRRIDIAGDDLSGTEYAAILSAASEKSIKYFEVPIEMVRENSEDMALMYEWFVSAGYTANIDALKQEFPEVAWETFRDWADRQNWSVLEG